MDQVSTVATRIAVRQLDGGWDEPDSVLGTNRRSAFPEFGDDGRRHEHAQPERNQRVGMFIDAEKAEPDHEYDRGNGRDKERAPQTLDRASAPGDQRANAGEEYQRQPNR